MVNIRRKIKESNSGVFLLLKKIYYFKSNFSIPAPKIIFLPLRLAIFSLISFFKHLINIFWIAPLYKTFFYRVGTGFVCGDFLPYVVGNGRIFVGNNVRIFGKLDVIFGAILEDIPEIFIGDNVTISHNVTFDVSSKLVIGSNTLIAENVTLQDCGGHQVDPILRAQGVPPDKSDVRPITIGENVWLCSSAYLLPGVKVGDNSIIGVGVVLRGSVPSGALIYSPPPKVMKYRSLTAFNKE